MRYASSWNFITSHRYASLLCTIIEGSFDFSIQDVKRKTPHFALSKYLDKYDADGINFRLNTKIQNYLQLQSFEDK